MMDLEENIERAVAEGIARAEPLAEAREALRALTAKSGLQQRMEQLRAARPPPPPAPPAAPPSAQAPTTLYEASTESIAAPYAPPAEEENVILSAFAERASEMAPSSTRPEVAEAEASVRELTLEEQAAAQDAAAAEAEAARRAAAAEMEAAAAAQKAAAEEAAAAQKAAARAAEIQACQGQIMDSLSLAPEERRQLLRKLQIKWHPDNFPGDDAAAIESREFANAVARIANEAANQAKRVRNKEIRAERQAEAFRALEAAMPSLIVGLIGGKGAPTNSLELREALELARQTGISDFHPLVLDAVEALRKAEAKEK